MSAANPRGMENGGFEASVKKRANIGSKSMTDEIHKVLAMHMCCWMVRSNSSVFDVFISSRAALQEKSRSKEWEDKLANLEVTSANTSDGPEL